MDQLSAIMTIKALDGLSARAEVVASNIANAGTRNFRPQAVSFEEALRDAAAAGADAVSAVTPQRHAVSRGLLGDGLRLDQELANASATSGRYVALVEILNRRLEIERVALTGGK